MALLLIAVQNLADLTKKTVVRMLQALSQVLVDGGFGDAEFLCGSAHCGTGLDHVRGQTTGPFVHIFPRRSPLRCC